MAKAASRLALPWCLLLATSWTRAAGTTAANLSSMGVGGRQLRDRRAPEGMAAALRKAPLAMMTGPALGVRGVQGAAGAAQGATRMQAAGGGRDEGEELLRKKGFLEGDRVILYDGVCNMCNGWVNYVMDRDPAARFKFAALQGESGRALMRRMGRNPEDLSTMVLLEADDSVYTKSEAVLRVLAELGGAASLLAKLTKRVVPLRLRDFVYADIVAPNRYKVFGKREASKCRRPTPAVRERFLD